MTLLFVILIIVASAVLSLIVLVQNPKGGGLAGNIGGFSNQFMGVKQTTDVLEKGTWISAAAIALLCLFSFFFISVTAGGSSTNSVDKLNSGGGPASSAPAAGQSATPSNTAPFQDSSK